MAELAITKFPKCEDLGDKIALEITPYYLKVIIGNKQTYYFDKEKGKFDGTSYQIAD